MSCFLRLFILCTIVGKSAYCADKTLKSPPTTPLSPEKREKINAFWDNYQSPTKRTRNPLETIIKHYTNPHLQ